MVMVDVKVLKQRSILEVAEALGYHFKRVSGQVYEHPDHDSFRIFAATNTFKWFSRDIGGDVIDFVQVVTGVSFKEALHFLKNGDFKEVEEIEPSYQPFRYALVEEPFRLARTYLKQVRGLSDQTINAFGQQGLLAQATYQTKEGREPVLVFKSYDNRGQLEGASLQGLVKNEARHERGYLKKIMKNSHGHIGMSFDIGRPKRLVFCESMIDMMSYYELHKGQLADVRLVSMEGLKQSVMSYQIFRLIAEQKGKLNFLETLNPFRLTQSLQILIDTTRYLQIHSDMVTLAVDNDEAGRDFCRKLIDNGMTCQLDLPTLDGRFDKVDWNDVLTVTNEMSLLKDNQSIHKGIEQAKPPPRPSPVLEM